MDDWQPNLQMFESMISAFSQQQSQGDVRNSREATIESFMRPESRNELIESTKGGFNIKTNGQSSFFPQPDPLAGVPLADDTFGEKRLADEFTLDEISGK